MKKLFTLLIVSLTCIAVHAVTINGRDRGNNVVMETFFPMPYISHSNISVTGALSLAGSFNSLVVGGRLLAPAGINAVGVLNFSGGDWTGTSLTVNPSSGNGSGGKTVFENNLKIQGTGSNPITLSSLGTSSLATMSSLNFAGKDLIPTCSGSSGSRMIQWTPITFGGNGQQTTGVFLTCGEGESFDPVSTPEHLNNVKVLMDFSSCDYDRSQSNKTCTLCSREYYDGGSLATLGANTSCAKQTTTTRYYSYASAATHLQGWEGGTRIGVNLPECPSTNYSDICEAQGRGYACVEGSLPTITPPTRYTYGVAGDWTQSSSAECKRSPRAYGCDNKSIITDNSVTIMRCK